jgi:hypothetical protein
MTLYPARAHQRTIFVYIFQSSLYVIVLPFNFMLIRKHIAYFHVMTSKVIFLTKGE